MNMWSIVNDAHFSPPLPRRAVPCPDEDLLSILRRSASLMGYPDVRWLLRPAEGKWILDEKEIPLLSAKGDYRILERLLLLSREELHSHTLHRFAPLLEIGDGFQRPPEGDPVSTGLPQLSPLARSAYFLPVRSIRVCPLCLQEPECYDRLYWRIQLLFHCPQHRVRLLEKCPSCKAPIAANRPSPYSCPRCRHGDYRSVDAAPLSPENPLYLGEQLLLEAFGIALPLHEVTSRSLASSPLPTLSSGSYLYLLEIVTSRLDKIFSHRELSLLMHLLCAFSPEGSPLLADLFEAKREVVFFLFHWLFLAWPTHFSTFLDAWYSLSTPPLTEKLEGVFFSSRSLFFDQFGLDAYGWLRQTYDDYHRQFHQNPGRVDHIRNSINLLARSMDSPQKRAETRRTGRDEERLYIPPRLLTPTIPYPWENLGSALSRAARKMGHPYPEQLLYHPHFSLRTTLSLTEFAQDEFPLPDYASNKTLAHLLQIPAEEIPRLTGSDLIRSLGLPSYNVFSQRAWLTEHGLKSWLLPYQHDTTRVCPYCVEEQEGYDRVFWNLQGVLCCPHHRARLLEKCPACLQIIPAIRPRTNQCPFCSRATYRLAVKRIPKNSALAAGTNLLLTKLGVSLAEAAPTLQFFGPSPLLDEKPPVYFALLIELTEEIGSYCHYAQEQLLQLCHILGEHTIPPAQTNDDPYAIDAGVVLFHTLFSRWPRRFFTFFDILYQKALSPARTPDDIYSRWRWLLRNKWSFIAPDWLFDAFEEHVQQYRSRAQRTFRMGGQGQIGGNFSARPDTPSS
jgi:TniQ